MREINLIWEYLHNPQATKTQETSVSPSEEKQGSGYIFQPHGLTLAAVQELRALLPAASFPALALPTPHFPSLCAGPPPWFPRVSKGKPSSPFAAQISQPRSLGPQSDLEAVGCPLQPLGWEAVTLS